MKRLREREAARGVHERGGHGGETPAWWWAGGGVSEQVLPTLLLDSAEVCEIGVGCPVERRAEIQHRHRGVLHIGDNLHARDVE
jgi:hypothetical protein